MVTYHITPAANALLVYLLDGQARTDVGPPEQLAEVETLLKAKLIALVADGEEMRLTPAGRRWATIKRDYPHLTRPLVANIGICITSRTVTAHDPESEQSVILYRGTSAFLANEAHANLTRYLDQHPAATLADVRATFHTVD